MITSGITAYRSTGSRVYLPIFLSHLSRAHAELGQFDDAWRCIGEAMTAVETTKERWYEAEINRIRGEIALKLPQLGPSQAEAYFERALAVARAQQAKSWELRAAMSMARLWRGQASERRPAIFSLQSIAGSRKASTRTILRRLRLCSMRCPDKSCQGTGDFRVGHISEVCYRAPAMSKLSRRFTK